MNGTRLTNLLIAFAGFNGLAESVLADYQRLDVQLHTQVNLSGQDYSVYRVYAVFNDPDDYLLAVFGSPTEGNIVIQSRNATDTAPGSNFYNPPGGGITAPTAASIAQNPALAWDTFVTIGVSIADQAPPPFDQTGVSPGFIGPNSGNSYNSNNAGWFTNGPQEQGRAGFAGDGDLSLRVMLLQLTVNSGDNVRGTVAILRGYDVPLAGTQVSLHIQQSFNSIPAPGGLAVLGLAGLVGPRRRVRT